MGTHAATPSGNQPDGANCYSVSYGTFRSTSMLVTVNTAAPTVTGVSSPTADGVYGAVERIDIAVTFSEAVTVVGIR